MDNDSKNKTTDTDDLLSAFDGVFDEDNEKTGQDISAQRQFRYMIGGIVLAGVIALLVLWVPVFRMYFPSASEESALPSATEPTEKSEDSQGETESHREEVKALLEEAQLASDAHDWQQTQEKIEETINLDAENEEAKKLLQEALTKQKEEVIALQNELQSLRMLIVGKRYDRGQTFGGHLDSLEQNYNAGLEALLESENQERFIQAHQRFKTALEEAHWIQEKIPIRDRLKDNLAELEESRKKAQDEGADRLALSDYEAADKPLLQARECFEQGDFEKAEELVQGVGDGFDRAFQNARNVKLDTLLNDARLSVQERNWRELEATVVKILVLEPNHAEGNRLKKQAEEGLLREQIEAHLASARQAMNDRKWSLARENAVETIKLDAENAEAMKLLHEAEQNMPPILAFYTNVKGKGVVANCSLVPPLMERCEEGFVLEKGKSYHIEALYQVNSEIWIGSFDFTANWSGIHEETIELKKLVIFNLNGILLKLLPVKAGRFLMGSPESELGRLDNERQHGVRLTLDFWLGETEVTQGQWKAIMGNNPSSFPKGDYYPVEQVTWNDAMDFCRKLNELYQEELPKGYEFSLPTEAQWEYACRAESTSALNNGKNLDTDKGVCSNFDEVGWYKENSDFSTHTVGQKRKNAWGFFDMHGNVGEWCHDWYGSYGGDETNPAGASLGWNRVVRGGGWNIGARYCRSANRYRSSPGFSSGNIGFRIALVPLQP